MDVINFPSFDKLMLLGIIALIVLGPKRLPGAARTAGRWVGELRKLSSRFQEEVHGALGSEKDELSAAVGSFRSEVGHLRNELHGIVLGAANTASGTTTTPLVTPAWPSDPVTSAPSSDVSPHSVSSGTSSGLPPLPPVPDDPSLN